jgi:hypothetical protein
MGTSTLSRITALPTTPSSRADPDGAIKPDIAAHPGIALVRTDGRLGRAHMPGLAKQHQRGDKNAESINLSPAFCEPPGPRFQA